MQIRRARWAALSALPLMCAAVFVAAPAASAATSPLLCLGTDTTTFSPGLTNTPRPTKVASTESLTPCTGSGITHGTGTLQPITVTADCLANVILTTPTFTYQWSDSQTSIVVYTSTAAVRLADGSTQVTQTGSVTSGFDQGASATQVIILPQLDLAQCATRQGVTELTGPVTLTFA